MVTRIEDIRLDSDPAAAIFQKQERVAVRFALKAGVVESREGGNQYSVGDALVTGSTGDKWTVSRDRFDAKYHAVLPLPHGVDGFYDNVPMPVFAKQIGVAFTIERSAGGDWISGQAMDWLIQYAPGDFGIVQDEKFRKVYQRLQP